MQPNSTKDARVVDFLSLNWRQQQQQQNNSNGNRGKSWAYEAAQLTRSLKIQKGQIIHEIDVLKKSEREIQCLYLPYNDLALRSTQMNQNHPVFGSLQRKRYLGILGEAL